MPYRYLIDFFVKGNPRSIKAKKNIAASMLIKSISVVIGFLLVSTTLDYVDKTRYGIWLTLSSFLTWFEFFELGFGKGLRNKLTEAIAHGNKNLAKIYVSTTYAIITLIIAGVALVFNVINPFINWTKVLNTSAVMHGELYLLSTIVFGGFFIRFILNLLVNVLFANQNPAVANAFGPLSNLLTLITVFILTKTTEGSLVFLGLAMTLSPLVVFSLATLIMYSGPYRDISPSFRTIDFKYARSLASLGIKFFILSIGHIIKYQTANIIIAQYFGPAEVIPYNVAFRYFGVLNIVFTIILSPLWVAFTDAWTKKDLDWIRNSVRKIFRVWILLSGFAVLMLLCSKWFYHMWLGDKVQVPFELSAVMALYYVLYNFGGIFVQFINGVSKIKLQLYSSVLGAILFFPLTYFLIEVLNLGPSGLVLSTLITNWYGPFLSPFQYRMIIENRAKGIWNK